jgi:hypothetical protein
MVAAVALSAPLACAQQILLVVDSSARAAHAFSPVDGSLIQSNYLSWDTLGTGSSTGKHALQVGNEIWVSDQIRDVIYRFNLDGTPISNIGPLGLDNIKGMEVVGKQVWVTNAGTANGAPGNAIVFVDIASASIVGSVPTVGSLFDLRVVGGEVLGTNITNHRIERYDMSTGALLGTFGAGAIRFPQQIHERANGNFLIAGFSTPSGIYEYSATGTELGIVAGSGGGCRAGYELANGSILWTNASGVWVNTTLVRSGGAQYVELIDLGPSCPGTGSGACSRADWTEDGVIDFNDFLAFLNDYNAEDPCADLNGDGVIDFNDFLEFLNLYNAGC